jgi:hypothetical protein
MPQKYLQSYTDNYKFILPSPRGPYFARCTLCPSDFGIGHGGKNDIDKHLKSKTHAQMVNLKGQHRDVSTSFAVNDKPVIRAECYMALFLIEHNLSISTSDHMSDLMGTMFPMYATAKSFSSKRTKTTHIIKEMAKDVKEQLVCKVGSTYISILTDGSSDIYHLTHLSELS